MTAHSSWSREQSAHPARRVAIVTPTPAPRGYVDLSVHLPAPGVTARAVVREDAVEGVRAALAAGGTLERWAASHPGRREMRGRGAVYAVPLPASGPAVVVRHARHGGLLAPLTGDRFLGSGRAPRELDVALRLAEGGVPTPSVVTYVVYRAGPFLSRIDVATGEIAGGLDLPAALGRWPGDRAAILHAVAQLLDRLARAGARHPDLNVKNVLLTNDPGAAPVAHVLDVDRVRFGAAGDGSIAASNVARLARSARKWARRGAALLSEDELAMLAAASGTPGAARR